MKERPKKERAPHEAVPGKKSASPQKAVAGKASAASKKPAVSTPPKTPSTAKKSLVSKTASASKKAPVPKASGAPKKAAPRAAGSRSTATRRESAAHRALAAELASLMPELDEEGLSFLVEQARVHLYNMEITRREAEAQALSSGAKTAKGGTRRSAAGSAPSASGVSASGPANFRVERSASGSSYHLITGGNWKMFTEGEMTRMVKIASVPDDVAEVATRLHAWLSAERSDAFADLELGDSRDPRLRELVLFLRSKFAIKVK